MARLDFQAAPSPSVPTRALILALLCTVLLFGAVGWHIWDAYQDLRTTQTHDARLLEITGVIARLDEKLTTSAELAASSGAPAWQSRYSDAQQELDRVISEARALAPDIFESDVAARTYAARSQLRQQEQHVFELALASRLGDAQTILQSAGYTSQKRAYQQGTDTMAGQIADEAHARLDASRRQATAMIVMLGVTLPLLFGAWLLILHNLRRNISARAAAEAALGAQQEELRDKSERLEQLLAAESERARRDPLTGALNRAGIKAELRVLIDSAPDGEPFAVAVVDLDGMKSINDTYGHQAGDDALRATVEALSRHGAIVGRYGGDEFVVIVPGAGAPAASRYRDLVMLDLGRARIALDHVEGGIAPRASIGIALYPDDARDFDALIEHADAAMYATRRNRPSRAA